jgi:hypothetical protein
MFNPQNCRERERERKDGKKKGRKEEGKEEGKVSISEISSFFCHLP